MASTAAAVKTKVTGQFTITAATGETYQVEEHSRWESKLIKGVKTEVLGRTYLLTADGRGVVKCEGKDSYSIPSLGIKATR